MNIECPAITGTESGNGKRDGIPEDSVPFVVAVGQYWPFIQLRRLLIQLLR